MNTNPKLSTKTSILYYTILTNTTNTTPTTTTTLPAWYIHVNSYHGLGGVLV